MTNPQIIEFYSHINNLKKIKRAGWVNHGIDDPENVASHSYGLATLTLTLSHKMNLNLEEVMIMALIHDLGESFIGDIITPESKEGVEDKLNQELPAIERVLDTSPNKDRLLKLWLDFEHGRTAEGKFVKELDKIEMCLQALHYEKEQKLDLSEFFDHTKKKADYT